jgi:hypothetical protein
MPWRGLSFLSGAQQVPVQRRLKSLSHSKGPPCFSFSLAQRAWLVGSHDPSQLRAPSLPSTRGAMAPSGAAIMAPSLGATNNPAVYATRLILNAVRRVCSTAIRELWASTFTPHFRISKTNADKYCYLQEQKGWKVTMVRACSHLGMLSRNE